MTALNVIQTRNAIHFFADGAFIDPLTGHMVATGQKVFAFPHARCAIGISGPLELCRHMGMVGQMCETIGQVIGDIEAILPQMIRVALKGWPVLNFGIYVGGFSPEGERQFYRLDAKTTDRSFKFVRCAADCWNYEPRLRPHTIRLTLGNERGDEFDRGFIERLDVADPIAHGLLALEAQRRLPVSDQGFPNGSAYTVGSFAQSTTVTIDRVETRILKRWADRCGFPIVPDGAAKVCQSGFGKISYQPQRAVGFKGENDAANGIETSASSNYDVNSTIGYVAPTASFVRLTGGTPSAPLGGTAANINDNNPATTASTNALGNTVGQTVAQRIVFKIDYGSNQSIGKIEVVGLRQDAGASAANGGLYYSTDNVNWTLAGAANIGSTTTPTNWSATGTFTARYIAYAVPQDSWTTHWTTIGDLNGYSTVVDDMTVVTAYQTADNSVSNARVLIEFDNGDSPTLNTDLTADVTCDGGANWSPASLVLVTAHSQDGRSVAETALTTCTAGTSVAARIKTANNKYVPIHGLALQWE